MLALGRAAAAFYQTAAGRRARDGDAAAVEARAREAGASNEDARAVRFALRGPARAPRRRAGAPPAAARVCQAEWAAAHEARLAEHLRAPAEDADAVDALAYHLEAELRAGDDANAAAFACLLERSRKRGRSSRAWTRRREAASRRPWRTRPRRPAADGRGPRRVRPLPEDGGGARRGAARGRGGIVNMFGCIAEPVG